MAKSTSAGVRAAHAALRSAALDDRGIPLRLLLNIVMTVGGVGEGTAYLALRAAIASHGAYASEQRSRWPEQVTITGSAQAAQVWQLVYTRADQEARFRRVIEINEQCRAQIRASRAAKAG